MLRRRNNCLPRYCVFLEKKASKELEKLGVDVRSRVVEALHTLRDEGFSRRLDIVKLRGYKSQYRLRIGKYRILFELRPERTIVVYAILPRKVAY
jgi:mRNA interferase RelE/StbE